jgi:hypothetical protein
MTDQADQQENTATARGEFAWREAMERVAERNERARKAGKQRREAYERQRSEARHAAERRRMAEVFAEREQR